MQARLRRSACIFFASLPPSHPIVPLLFPLRPSLPAFPAFPFTSPSRPYMAAFPASPFTSPSRPCLAALPPPLRGTEGVLAEGVLSHLFTYFFPIYITSPFVFRSTLCPSAL